MKNDNLPQPVRYKGVMISSTFTDLIEHRAVLIQAIRGSELFPVAMENDSAKPGVDVIDSSLQMVRNAFAYVGVISQKYGQIPESPERNPNRLSLTELEFNEAQRLGRPVLLFIMGDRHSLIPADFEQDTEKKRKLEAFKENAKRMNQQSSVHRVYKVFNNLNEFQGAAFQAIGELRRYLDQQDRLNTLQPQDDFPGRGLSKETESETLTSKDEIWSKLQYLLGESKLTLLFGNITRSKDDVIVSSDDYLLSAKGGVSKAIRLAGGDAITIDADKMVPLTLGEVVPTTAGNLPARYIFHAVTIAPPDPSNKFASSRYKLLPGELTKKCILLLTTLNQESISFPALGTGYARIPLKLVVTEMIQTMSIPLSSRRVNATIYIYDDKLDHKNFKEFLKEVVSSTPKLEKYLVSSSPLLPDTVLPDSPRTIL